MIRYIIGDKVDKDFSLEISTPEHPTGTSELCRKDDLYEIKLTAPYKNKKEETFLIHLYASNSNSNPYLFQKDNYWANLIPTWKFYDETGEQIITDIPITATYKEEETGKEHLVGSAKFNYVDDMPSPLTEPIYIWATLDTEKIISTESDPCEEDPYETEETTKDYDVLFPGTTIKKEKITNNNKSYTPPSYANSKIIVVGATTVNPIPPTKLAITRNSIDSISNGTYWSNQVIPFIATVNSHHYEPFREKEEMVDYTSNIVYNYPNIPHVAAELSGIIYLKYDDIKTENFSSLIEKYVYFVENEWDFVSKYLPPKEVLKTSGYIPEKNILEIMDYPTYDDLKKQYPDIPLDNYFEHHCNTCKDQQKPDENILYLDEYSKLINEHKIFKYVPYALRVIDTLSLNAKEETEYAYSQISALSATGDFDYAKIQLLDDFHDYNYRTGGYAFGKALCPDLHENDYVGMIDASAYANTTQNPKMEFHIFKYWVISDSKFVYAADDRNVTNKDNKILNEFIKDEIGKSVPDKKIDDLVKTEEDKQYFIQGNYIGASCTVVDPLYNAWICDADTGYLYKFNIYNELKYQINLNEAIDEFIRNNIRDRNLISYWNDVKNSGRNHFVSPTHMVLDSNNNLYITFFDTMIFAKLNGLNGQIIDVYLFPNTTAKDSGGVPLDGSWRPVGIDTNELDEVVILFNTAYNEDDPDPTYQIPSDAKLVFFDGKNFYDEVITLSDCGDGIFTEFTDRHLDTTQVIFRSAPGVDYIYVSGSIEYVGKKEYAFILRYQRKRQEAKSTCPCCDPNESKTEIIFKYERLCSLNTRPDPEPEQPGPPFDYIPEENPPLDFHVDIDSMFLDMTDSLWFALNKDYSQSRYYHDHQRTETTPQKIICPFVDNDNIELQTGDPLLDNQRWIYRGKNPNNENYAIIANNIGEQQSIEFSKIKGVIIIKEKTIKHAPIKSELLTIKGAKERMPHAAVFIPIYDVNWITGISQSSTSDILLVDAENNRIAKFTPKKNSSYLTYHMDYDIKIENPEYETYYYEISKLFARGDWTGMDWANKYIRTTNRMLSTDIGKTKLNLLSYEKRYIRKHQEEWDVAEHAKVPVAHTFFPEENPDLFEAIGETLGIDEHKHYSIGKKLFEGIANQVSNIHDIDECHINSIYALSNKEDVNIDKFILNYPEELRRMTDLLSITRKKLWGDRCHCTQNYFKTKKRDETRYCPKCKHVHTTNVGSTINPLDCGIWALIQYNIKYEIENQEQTWFNLVNKIFDQIIVLNNVLELQPKISDDIEITKMVECIEPINSMLTAIEEYVHHPLTKVTKTSTSYDIVNAIKFVDNFIKTLPDAYLIEDKFNRNDFLKITISKKSYQEAEEIYNEIKEGTYLTAEDVSLMNNGKTNANIILYASILNIEEEALNTCSSLPIPSENVKCAQLLAIHTSFFSPDHWFNYCFWRFRPYQCHILNTSVINWESQYTTMDEYDETIKKDWYKDNGMMIKLMNYIIHNGTLFHKNEEYIDD